MRFPQLTRNLLTGGMCVLLVACGTPSSNEPGISKAEQELRQQSEAFNRTLLEGALAGAALGGATAAAFGGDRNDIGTGIVIGGLTGLAAGSYVAYVQKEYTSKEDRLEQLTEDANRANAEAEATLVTMRQVRDQQLAELAAARAANDADALRRETEQAKANQIEMERAVSGAEKQYSELSEARGLVPISNTQSEIDPQLNELSQRITAMRQVAETLASEV
jgi:gas vesicle protein